MLSASSGPRLWCAGIRPAESRDPFGVAEAGVRLETAYRWLDDVMAGRASGPRAMPSASPIALPRPPCSTQIGLIRFPKYSPTFTPIGGAYSRAHRSPAQWRKRAHTARFSRSARPTGTDGQRQLLHLCV